jgi:WD40 repeat protein
MEQRLPVAVGLHQTQAQNFYADRSVAADGTIKVWNAGSGKLERSFEGHIAGISTLAWSPDSRWVASGGDDKVIRLWDVQTVYILHTMSPSGLFN